MDAGKREERARRARAAGLALALPLLGCGPDTSGAGSPGTSAPDTVVLVTLDTTRADHLATYGYGRATDARLRALAERSRVFENAFPSGTWTLPSHASLFTGLDPAEHGCWQRVEEDVTSAVSFSALADGTPRFTDRLDAAGWRMVGAVGGPFTRAQFGFARGFDAWFEPSSEAKQASGTELNAFLLPAIRATRPDEPLFVFANYFDAHSPYDAPRGRAWAFPEDGREPSPVPKRAPDADAATLRDATDQYDRELVVQDEALGELLDALEAAGRLANALVIVTADHGEMFGERGLVGHGCLPYEPVARVPLVVFRSGASFAGERVATPVSNASVPRTILAATGLATLPPGGAPRVDLLASASELAAEGAPPFVEHRSDAEWFGVLRGERFKYLCELGEAGRVEFLVDLATNPEEEERRASGAEASAALERLRAELDGLLERWRPPAETGRTHIDDPATLEALGY